MKKKHVFTAHIFARDAIDKIFELNDETEDNAYHFYDLAPCRLWLSGEGGDTPRDFKKIRVTIEVVE